MQVVPDESRLGVASVQLAPFEILGGEHPPDTRAGSRRFFQYRYDLRIIDPDVIGRDVNVPPLVITYRVHSRVGAAASLEGRDLTYLLPVIPLKVLSLVPAEAPDIRDAGRASFSLVDALRFRSSAFRILAIALGLLAVVVAALALVPVVRRTRADGADDHLRVPDHRVLGQVAAELAVIQGAVARDGWTDALVSRALRAMRLVASFAIGHPVSQRPIEGDGPVPESRLLVEHGRYRPVRASVSSGVTADDVSRAIAALPATATETTRQQWQDLQAALSTLTAAFYPRTPVRDASALDDAVRHGVTMAQLLQRSRRTLAPRIAPRADDPSRDRRGHCGGVARRSGWTTSSSGTATRRAWR